MVLKKQNPWKLLSVGLLATIAVGLFAPVNAQTPPSGSPANQFGVIFQTLEDIQLQINQIVTDLAAEETARANGDDALQTQINADGDTDSSNEDQALSSNGGDVVLGTTEAGDGGGTVTCAQITGDVSLCDGDDANTEYDGTDFATSSQNCGEGMSVTGIDENGAITCTTTVGEFTKTVRTNKYDIAAHSLRILGADCLDGEIISGGGHRTNDNPGALFIYGNSPTTTINGNEAWVIDVTNYANIDIPLTVYAICISTTP